MKGESHEKGAQVRLGRKSANILIIFEFSILLHDSGVRQTVKDRCLEENREGSNIRNAGMRDSISQTTASYTSYTVLSHGRSTVRRKLVLSSNYWQKEKLKRISNSQSTFSLLHNSCTGIPTKWKVWVTDEVLNHELTTERQGGSKDSM